MKKGLKITLIILWGLLGFILLDTLQAKIFKNSPIISIKQKLDDESYIKKGIFVDTFYCTNEKDIVTISTHFKSSKYSCAKSNTNKEYEEDIDSEDNKDLPEILEVEINSEATIYSLLENKDIEIISEDEKIDTTILGEQTFTVNYMLDNEEKEFTLKVNVVDTTAPEIKFNTSLSTTEGTKIDLLKGVSVTDNSKEEIKATVDGSYNFNKVGTYKLKYVAIDSSNNKVEEEFTLKVNKKIVNQSTPNETNNKSNEEDKTNNEKTNDNETSKNEEKDNVDNEKNTPNDKDGTSSEEKKEDTDTSEEENTPKVTAEEEKEARDYLNTIILQKGYVPKSNYSIGYNWRYYTFTYGPIYNKDGLPTRVTFDYSGSGTIIRCYSKDTSMDNITCKVNTLDITIEQLDAMIPSLITTWKKVIKDCGEIVEKFESKGYSKEYILSS